jgi:hypothetical protein
MGYGLKHLFTLISVAVLIFAFQNCSPTINENENLTSNVLSSKSEFDPPTSNLSVDALKNNCKNLTPFRNYDLAFQSMKSKLKNGDRLYLRSLSNAWVNENYHEAMIKDIINNAPRTHFGFSNSDNKYTGSDNPAPGTTDNPDPELFKKIDGSRFCDELRIEVPDTNDSDRDGDKVEARLIYKIIDFQENRFAAEIIFDLNDTTVGQHDFRWFTVIEVDPVTLEITGENIQSFVVSEIPYKYRTRMLQWTSAQPINRSSELVKRTVVSQLKPYSAVPDPVLAVFDSTGGESGSDYVELTDPLLKQFNDSVTLMQQKY